MDHNLDLEHGGKELTTTTYLGAPEHMNSLLFFNVHEYLEGDESLCVTHFPNNHFRHKQDIYAATRIVRVPRIYDTNPLSDSIPQFSTYIPGTEPAALNPSGERSFNISGVSRGDNFGKSSWSPLVPSLIPDDTFVQIVEKVNEYIYSAMSPYDWRNCIRSFADILTGGIYSKTLGRIVGPSFFERMMSELENYIDHLNSTILERIEVRLISPKASAFLSVSSLFSVL